MYNYNMKDYCIKCGACCKNIKIDKNKELLQWDGSMPLTKEFEAMLLPINIEEGIYTCKHLKENLCTNKNKPDICKNYPSFPFTQLADGCGYEGEIFLKKEKIKHKIRKLKEEKLHYQTLSELTQNKKEQQQYQKLINLNEKAILKYQEYGSENW